MSSMFGFLCLDGQEIGNIDRGRYHLSLGLLGAGYRAPAGCDDCDHVLLEDGETYSEFDMPWMDASVWASNEFLGVLPERIELGPPTSRAVTAKHNGGGALGRTQYRPRELTFVGHMIAQTPQGMEYGERWLNEVLRGGRCDDCQGSEALVLPSCPEVSYSPGEQALRRLLGVGLVDGPTFSQLQTFPQGKVQVVSFQLVSSESYLYSMEELQLSHTVQSSSGTVCTRLDASEWSDAVPVVSVEALDGPATNIVVTFSRTGDGFCAGDGEACATFTIPSLVEDAVVTIDAVRRQVRYYDPSSKKQTSGLPYLTLTEPIVYPVVAPCGSLCACVTVGSGEVRTDVSKVERYL